MQRWPEAHGDIRLAVRHEAGGTGLRHELQNRTRITAAAIRGALYVCAFAVIACGLPAQDTFDKNDFLSRRKWYVTFTFSLKGKGEATRTEDNDHYSTSWSILREVSGTFELDHAGQDGPRNSVLAPGEGYQGRYISWDATEGLSNVSYIVDDSVEHEQVEHGEGNAETIASGYTKFAGKGTEQIGRFKELKCDLKDMVFDFELTALGGWSGDRVVKPLQLSGEYHDFTPITKVGEDITYPLEAFSLRRVLPDIEPLEQQLVSRKLQLSGDRILINASMPIETLPYLPDHSGINPGSDFLNGHTTAGGPPLELSLNVVLSPGPLSRAQLILETSDYDTWRPQCSSSEEKRGNQFKLAWRVEEEGGDSAKPTEVRRVEFTLRNTSKEPGVCMNFPLRPKAPADFDLKFEKPTMPRAGYDATIDGQKLTLSDSLVSAGNGSIAIDCFDSGAWSEISATAELADGRKLTGHLKGNPAAIRLLIPKRTGGSYIADAWKAAHDITAADNDDAEKLPSAGKTPGDGFTLYEEYRGFVENGKHIEGDPKKIDFFVRNYIGGDARPGIELFAGLTGAEVHERLRDAEFDPEKRVMNANHDRGPHRVDQHGIYLRTKAGLDGAKAVFTKAGVRGRPAICAEIVVQPREAETSIMTSENLPASELIFAYDRAIAHELLHAVGGEHHGSGDGSTMFHFVFADDPRNKTGKPVFWIGYTVNRSVVTIIDEATGRDLAVMWEPDRLLSREQWRESEFPKKLANEKEARAERPGYTFEFSVEDAAEVAYNNSLGFLWWYVGAEHGECSGDEGCVMRYYFAKLYEKKGVAHAFYYISDKQTERAGLGLCRSPVGTGINAPGRKPQPRYGDAKAGWGPCADWIVFNDAVPPNPEPKP